MRWPPIMPSWCYRDPATIGEAKPLRPELVPYVSRETVGQVQTRAPDRYYTQARRLHIRLLMKGR